MLGHCEIEERRETDSRRRYQPGGSAGFDGTADPLSDPTTCLRDAIIMQQLGANTIRIYNLSPDLNHDECVSIFNTVCLRASQSGTPLPRMCAPRYVRLPC